MKILLVIPARYGSTRLPGKPLLNIKGVSLLERVWKIANNVKSIAKVVVATDDKRIFDHVKNFGGEALMTPSECANGSERALQTINILSEQYDAVINLQGDTPLTPPWVIEKLAESLSSPDMPEVVTGAVVLSSTQLNQAIEAKNSGSTTGTFVVCDRFKNAMYFSRSIIPFNRSKTTNHSVLKHIGIYGYRISSLKNYFELSVGELEQIEGLEQLRFLENGIKIKVEVIDLKGRTLWSVDNPEDIEIVENIINKEGELIP
jgi:3-deoxy-manno-octulosonate cytidylyltransferase (CMP-KDO synthetase)